MDYLRSVPHSWRPRQSRGRKHFAKFYGIKLGDGLSFGNTNFEVVGIVSAQDESQVSATNVYMNLGDAQKLLGTDGYSELYVKLDGLSSEGTVRSAISRVSPSAVVISADSIAASLVLQP